MRNLSGGEEDRNKETSSSSSSSSNFDSRFSLTLRNIQGLLKGRSFPGKVSITRHSDPLEPSFLPSPRSDRRFSDSDVRNSGHTDSLTEDKIQNSVGLNAISSVDQSNSLSAGSKNITIQIQNTNMGARATDSARLMKFTKELSEPTIVIEKIRELAWSGVPSYLRPTVWRILVGYAPSNSDRREAVLRRKRLEYLDCVALHYDIPDTERTEEEITMLRQIALDCPRTVPDVSFFQREEVQKSLERILYTWAIRHPASGYVQGINDLATPFLVVFLSEYLEGNVETWSMADLPPEKMLDIEADCYWCLTKLLDGMQDHYTFAQPGIQRLVFKLKELVGRIDEPCSKHMEDQGLEFLQFAFRWFNCLLIREIPFDLVTRLWDTYLAEGVALPDFLVYIYASFLLTWSETLQKLDFQEMVMFLQHLPTHNWIHLQLETVLSQAYMWYTMFNDSPRHLAC
ncbi:Ypt/Rab-GAP domain of gyp1p superfamily protein [Perilla frutescens var. frutescens]|nr:Ypt/Rab-GAP domain of gyp1p superfamily protein [Perilla frutescens var. frutescens]